MSIHAAAVFAQTVCRSHRLALSTELAAVVKGRLATRCAPVARPVSTASAPDC